MQARREERDAIDVGLSDRYEARLGDIRLLYVAAETGARFVREQINTEPLAWLLASRDLFNGGNALTACRSKEGFRRAAVLHGLSLGLDAPPASLQGIPHTEFLTPTVRSFLGEGRSNSESDWTLEPRDVARLFTTSVSVEVGRDHVHLFCAMLAQNSDEVRARLRRRHGPMVEDQARIRQGFDWSEPIACAMVSDAMGELLMLVDADPGPWLLEGLDFQVEQRFTVDLEHGWAHRS